MIIFRSIFGSRLYGTSTESSDTDFKSVAIPPLRDVILQRVKKSTHNNTKSGDGKNSSEDIDEETYSIQYFIHLLLEGQTTSIDMIHAPNEYPTDEWTELYENRERFYTCKMQAFMGYALHQSAKYGIKGSRISSARKLLESLQETEKLSDATIPYDEHCKSVIMESTPPQPAVEICGKMFALNTKTQYVIPIVEKFLNEYGKRALMAEKNEGTDMKAISHAFRSCLQIQEICETGDLKYPLKDAEKLRQIKLGLYGFKVWREELESEIDKTKDMLAKSGFPDEPDYEWADQYLLNLYHT